jgi:lysyl-tRNA synthetase class 2
MIMKTWKLLKENPKLWQRYFVREYVIKATRRFFDDQKFHEVETPILIAHPPAESYLDVFETTLLDRHRNPHKAYLSTSPEVPLKKLMVAGLGHCYALTKSFRNMETQSKLHNPEFTILEWYRVGVDYKAIMEDCERLVLSMNHLINPKSPATLRYQGKTIDISPGWERLTVARAFRKYAGVDFDKFLDFGAAKKIAKKKGYRIEPNTTWEELYNQIFLNEIEQHLGQTKPTILYEFPGSMAALAKTKASDPRFAERFEFYIAGLELGDCYSELTDWQEQEYRFEKEITHITRLGKTVYDYDHDFIDALKVGLPTCSGIAIGIDRLVMLFADSIDIAETMFFPGKEEFLLSE